MQSNPMVQNESKVNHHAIVLFDGVCNLCSSIVQFMIKRDPSGKFVFASLQSATGQVLLQQRGLPTQKFDSFVLIEGDQYFLRSTAALRAVKFFPGLWKFLYVFIFIPVPIRDSIYNWVAKNRYRLFGKQDSCLMPTAALKDRFLE